MSLSSSAWQAVVGSCICLLLAPACGGSGGSNVSGTGATGSGATGSGATGNGTSGTSNGPDLSGVAGDGTTTGTDPLNPGEACAGEVVQGERIPLDIYIMLDVSGSMLQPTDGDASVTKWQAVSSAITDFVSDKASEGLGVGLQVFPVQKAGAAASCTSDMECGKNGPCLNRYCWPFANGQVEQCLDDSTCGIAVVNGKFYDQKCTVLGMCAKDNTYACDPATGPTCSGGLGACTVPPSVCVSAADCRPATYAAAAADIAALPGAKDGILKVIAASTPADGALTPTGPALTGAIQKSSAWATAHPDHQVVAVLATDGSPTLRANANMCAVITDSADLQAVVDVAAAGKAGTPSISTFVIGVLGGDDPNAPVVLSAVANAGGSGDAFIVDTSGDVEKQFRDALDQIRAKGLTCDLAIPMPATGETLDYDKVNVEFSGDPNLARVDTAADCTKVGGWYYDVAPADGTPTRIVACPTTCDAFKATDMGSVKIQLGCKTRVVVK